MAFAILLRFSLACLLSALLLTACLFGAMVNPDFNPTKFHHRSDGFINRYAERSEKSGFWTWQFQRLKDGLPKAPSQPVEGVTPDFAFLHHNQGGTSVTWIGHATLLLQLDGMNILTDPQWSERASPVGFAGPKRHQPPGVPFDALPPIHAVLISHNHYDHLDRDTVQRLLDRHKSTIRFYVPLGVQHWFAATIEGVVREGPDQNLFALDWDENLFITGQTGPIELRFLAIQHWSARTLWDRYQTLWGSWAVLHPSFRFWFSGDLAYSPDTKDIGERLGEVDLAAIAIGGYEPRWFLRESHLNPAEAVQVMKDVRAKQALGIHWGTFEGLTDEPLDQPPRDLQQAAQEAGLDPALFFVLKHGETRQYPP